MVVLVKRITAEELPMVMMKWVMNLIMDYEMKWVMMKN
jgi:hypothetical protein